MIVAFVLASGINLLPTPNFDTGNVQIAVAYAESKNFAAKEAAMTDVEIIEAQAKEASRLRAIEAVKEKIASYVRNFSGAKGKLNEDDIAAIAEKFEEVGEAKYKKLFYNAVDEEGKELGKVGIMYEATVTAKFNSKKITEYIKLTEQEKEKRIRQAREAREHFEELDREYEELRKNARTKTSEQLQTDIKIFDDKISDLEKRRGKNKSVKKDNPTTKQDKIQPMKFSNPVEIGGFGWGNLNHGGAVITGASYVSETPIKHGKDVSRWEYSKGVARFGDGKEAVYLHYAKGTDFKIGSEVVNSTIHYNHMWTTIFKVSAKNGYTMYFLKQYFDSPAPAYHYILIGQRPDGKWVKYFNTEDLCKQYLGSSKNVSIPKVTSNGDTIIVSYARCNHLPKEMGGYFYEKLADEFGEFRFKWDEKAQWFGVEKVDSQNKPEPQKTTQENKPVTNQPMQFSQPVRIGTLDYSEAGNHIRNIAKNSSKVLRNTDTGISEFGTGEDIIYIHYAPRQEPYFGDKNKNNAFQIKVGLYGEDIFQIKNNSKIKFYILQNVEATEGVRNYICLGKREDGKFVKYFETNDMLKQYFGIVGLSRKGHYVKKIYCKGDTIIVEYMNWIEFNKVQGEFRYKWDEKAQWFSVEQIKY